MEYDPYADLRERLAYRMEVDPFGGPVEMHRYLFGKSTGRINYDLFASEVHSVSSVVVSVSRALATRGASIATAAFMRTIETTGNAIDDFKIALGIPVEHY